ncbi:MAG: DHA2 family efflux MFS transporter permease subunit [Actinophytocola sp.]|uniref:DHA2 family efflux MFS transporter permease subunit n=1 Tax=Actinophytocola sp. TaxID=1872138 RepID=UPI003D6A3842
MPSLESASVPRRWWALGAIAVALLTVGLDVTVLHVALPTLATGLGASTTELQWFANAYTLVLAAGLLPAGMLGDRFGRKRMFLGALAVFGVASVGCAFAGSAELLIVARVALGVGAAFMIPLSISLLRVLFSDAERPRAIALWTTATTVGIPLGPVLGGWLLDHYWWGSVFLINVPLVVVGAVAIAWLVPSTPGSGRRPVDFVGVGLSSAGLVALTYGLTAAGSLGWTAATAVPVLAGAALLTGFVLWLRRARHPLVDLDLFRSTGFASGATLATLASFTMMGAIFVLPQYFQAMWDTDAFGTGLRLLPVIGGLLVGVQVGERLLAPLGEKAVVAAGFVLMAAGLLIGATAAVGDGYGFAAGWMAVAGLGLGLALPPAMNAAIGALAAEDSGVGGGLVHALRQVGGTLGVAVLGTALNASYRSTVDASGVSGSDAGAVLDTAAAGLRVARTEDSQRLADSVREAFSNGMSTLLVLCAVVMLGGAVLAVAVLPTRAVNS